MALLSNFYEKLRNQRLGVRLPYVAPKNWEEFVPVFFMLKTSYEGSACMIFNSFKMRYNKLKAGREFERD